LNSRASPERQVVQHIGQMTKDSRPIKRIAVIGGGAAGVAQAKEILDAFRPGMSDYQVSLTVYEARDDLGGVW
jgi:cation diffusion facilitator CzcD-associated flavoprotein CzcO